MARHALAPAYLAVCILLGGASANGLFANLVLQVLGLGLLLVCFVARSQQDQRAARLLWFCLAVSAATVIAQLVPMPPVIWTHLPGRGPVVQGFMALDKRLPWLPTSMAPLGTLASVFWLVPAFAIFFTIARFGGFRGRWLAWTLAAAMALSVMVGAIQVAGGEGSPADFYGTSKGMAVGFFANSNHLATLLLMTIPFLAALAARQIERGKRDRRVASVAGLAIVAAAGTVVALTGIFISRSLAGWGLSVPVTLASLLLLRGDRPVPKWVFASIGALAIAAAMAVLSAPMGNNLTSDQARTADQSRYVAFTRTISIIPEYLPLGSGIGSFVPIYRRHEAPDAVTDIYLNHAHNEYLEIALEAGLPGLLAIGLFLIWWGSRVISIWRDRSASPITRAATIAGAVPLLHSLVDYPLRTAAISALFAMTVALMLDPRPRSRVEQDGAARHLSAE